MSNLKVSIRHIKVIEIARQEVGKKQALEIEGFANKNCYERAVDMKGIDSQYVRFELDRRSTDTPFIVIDEKSGVYAIFGKLRGLHADLFLEDFCNE